MTQQRWKPTQKQLPKVQSSDLRDFGGLIFLNGCRQNCRWKYVILVFEMSRLSAQRLERHVGIVKFVKMRDTVRHLIWHRGQYDNIWLAAQFGELPVVRHHLRQDPALLNQKDEGPGPRRAVAPLQPLGAPSSSRGWGQTPLMRAADVKETMDSWPNAAVVDFLLQRKADVAPATRGGRRPRSRPDVGDGPPKRQKKRHAPRSDGAALGGRVGQRRSGRAPHRRWGPAERQERRWPGASKKRRQGRRGRGEDDRGFRSGGMFFWGHVGILLQAARPWIWPRTKATTRWRKSWKMPVRTKAWHNQYFDQFFTCCVTPRLASCITRRSFTDFICCLAAAPQLGRPKLGRAMFEQC